LADLPFAERRRRLWQLLDELASLLRAPAPHGGCRTRDLKAANVCWSARPAGRCRPGAFRELPLDPEVSHDRVSGFIDLVGGAATRGVGGGCGECADLARLHVSFLDHSRL